MTFSSSADNGVGTMITGSRAERPRAGATRPGGEM